MMRSFHGDSAIKEKYLARVREHQRLDNLVQQVTWNGERGCAVGCTLEKYDHRAYETELGIPEWLARVEDSLFEGMTWERAKTWPDRFLDAIPVGADLEKAKAPFMIFILETTLENFDHKKFPDVKEAVDTVIDLWKTDPSAARSAAWSAARSAARSAAWSAAWSAAESAAWSAARSAAWSAARSAAWSAAESAAFKRYADKLLEILASVEAAE